jgi:hypothetical protein
MIGNVIHYLRPTELTSALLIEAVPCNSQLSFALNKAFRLNPEAFYSCSFGFTFLRVGASSNFNDNKDKSVLASGLFKLGFLLLLGPTYTSNAVHISLAYPFGYT